MKKRISSILLLVAAFVGLGLMSSCDKSDGDLKSILKTVPADAPYVMAFNVNPVLDQLEFKKDGDRYTFCKEVQEIVDLSGADKKMVNTVCEFIDATGKTLVLYGDGSNLETVWMTFSVNNQDEFVKLMEKVAKDNGGKLDFKEEGGYKMGADGIFAMKDNRVWMCSEKIDVKKIDKFADLGDDSFAAKNGKLTDRMTADNTVTATCVNLTECLSALRKTGGDSEVGILQSAMSLLFEDATYLFATSTLNNQGAESVAEILNSKYETAKFLLPVGKIEPAAMAKINNNAGVVAAVNLPSELMSKISGLITTLNGGDSAETKMITGILNSISGTLAVSINGPEEIIASIPFTDEASATSFGELMAQSGMDCSVAGNYLVMRSKPGLQGGGSAPESFKGEFAAYNLNFANVPETLISGLDMKSLGKVSVTLGQYENGLRLNGKWECNRLIPTVCSLVRKGVAGYLTGEVKIPMLDGGQAYPEPDAYDSVYVEEAVAEEVW